MTRCWDDIAHVCYSSELVLAWYSYESSVIRLITHHINILHTSSELLWWHCSMLGELLSCNWGLNIRNIGAAPPLTSYSPFCLDKTPVMKKKNYNPWQGKKSEKNEYHLVTLAPLAQNTKSNCDLGVPVCSKTKFA